jgi:putative tryptophan/tyrosine transport system substrate-binding protein
MRRREVITLLGIAAMWPISGIAQQLNIPIIGFLTARSENETAESIAAFRDGLQEAGYRDAENVSIDFRWANGEYHRLPELAVDLVQHGISVVVTSGGNAAAHAAKNATTTIPIVSLVTDDPVRDGLVSSLAHPGGNLTGVNFLTTSLESKRLQLLHEAVPRATKFAVLINPNNLLQSEIELRDVPAASSLIGLQLTVFRASDVSGIDAAFAVMADQKIEALLVASDTFFFARRDQITRLAAHYALPAIYQLGEYAKAGGLMSYGTSLTDAYHQLGLQTARVLKGAQPATLPVMQSVKFECVVNLKTAKVLGVTIPASLLATADEVIE